MAREPDINFIWEEVKFRDIGLSKKNLITRTDKEGVITFASKAFSDMSGYLKNELLNIPHNIVRHPFMPESVFKDLWETILCGGEWRGIIMNLRKDGRYFWVDTKINPIDKNGDLTNNPEKIVGFVAVMSKPSRTDIKTIKKIYGSIRKSELSDKKELRPWEKELLKTL